MLRAEDVPGQTPLHLAVEYSMYTGQRIAVVKGLIARKSSVTTVPTEIVCERSDSFPATGTYVRSLMALMSLALPPLFNSVVVYWLVKKALMAIQDQSALFRCPEGHLWTCSVVRRENGFKGTSKDNNISQIATIQIEMHGFIVLNHAREFATARAELAQWIADGKLKRAGKTN
ncbi:Ff.00g065210.m01.CDS01 [Fusarium sp. VM40]|nr:Ff.00g065210.m01.CDS01 [Fusarium sp. VM40]